MCCHAQKGSHELSRGRRIAHVPMRAWKEDHALPHARRRTHAPSHARGEVPRARMCRRRFTHASMCPEGGHTRAYAPGEVFQALHARYTRLVQATVPRGRLVSAGSAPYSAISSATSARNILGIFPLVNYSFKP